MKKSMLFAGLVLLFAAAFVSIALAGPGGPWRGSRGWGPGSDYHRMYDPNTVVTVQGEVVSLDNITPFKGMGVGVQLKIKTDSETLIVHLGPAWYLENQDVHFAPKDMVTVKGSKVTFKDKPVVIAAEITKGNEILKLRDDSGFPVWAGWRNK